jgi:uncharacterized protein YbjT (DUF2867 family)
MGSLPTRVLVTGATGYIGRRLADRLIREDGVSVRLFVRNAAKLGPALRRGAEVFEGNTLDPGSLAPALQGIDAAYYLVHSMGAGPRFPELDRRSAANFRDACISAGVRRIVYLGGLGDKDSASRHLRSRIETGEILSGRPGPIQTVWLRAGVIIGSGSASFEIIRGLVEKLPVMIAPRFVQTRTQPIGVGDVIRYLAASARIPGAGNLVVDIGSDIMTFREMLLRTAAVMGLKRWLIPVPVFTPRLASYWLVLMTPVPFRIASALVNGLKSESVARNDLAAGLFPDIKPLGFEAAVRQALGEVSEGQVLSAWCDSSAGGACDVAGRDEVAAKVLKDERSFPFPDGVPAREVFAAVQAIGGRNGWYTYNWLWKIRGFVDKLLGGPGLSRGRRDPTTLRLGDSLDFWKVADQRDGRRLLLANQMKVPGEAWLEFVIEGKTLVQRALFLPRGLWGRLYWLLMKPFHALVFGSMGRAVIKKAKAAAAPDRPV